ncbi:hypothetical protein [Jannaschia marina]|uniref:hypothetical protein n=1 Tax=Jannaschia marina TaxID=2741674 RepID=UPI0015CA5B70|nr:hypothetical protein [Jannaschia marina]
MSLRRFLAAETGAVTVDWVVLTAAMVGLALAVSSVVSDGLEELAREVAQFLADIEIRTRF